MPRVALRRGLQRQRARLRVDPHHRSGGAAENLRAARARPGGRRGPVRVPAPRAAVGRAAPRRLRHRVRPGRDAARGCRLVARRHRIPQDDGRAGAVRGRAGSRQPGGAARVAHQGGAMSDEIMQRLSTEGVDPLALAGVNDGNLVELAKRLGVRVSLRGDTLTLHGPLSAVERAAEVAQALVDLARMGDTLDVSDVDRVLSEEAQGTLGRAATGGPGGPGVDGEYKIILPGLRRVIAPKTAGQRDYLHAIAQYDIVIGIGPAGTGKTYLAVAAAVDALARKRVRRIILARPAVEAGESLGFLPGDVQEKVDPYLRPLYDALEDMMPRDRVQKAIDSRTIEIAPLAYMRGRTLSDAFVILDEAQNATGMQMKMFLTRLGVNSKAVITGDKTQIDLTNREDSGLLQIERILPGIDGIGFCYLTETDVVRHRLVRDIIRAYAEDAQG